MITTLITGTIGFLFTAIFSFLPEVHIVDIPYIGETLYSLLVGTVTTWNAFLVTFPYAVVGWTVFKYVIIPFEVTMLVAKFLLGSRHPSNHV